MSIGVLKEKKGTIHAPIARKDGSIMEREVNFENGQNAITQFEVLDENIKKNISLVHLKLETRSYPSNTCTFGI